VRRNSGVSKRVRVLQVSKIHSSRLPAPGLRVFHTTDRRNGLAAAIGQVRQTHEIRLAAASSLTLGIYEGFRRGVDRSGWISDTKESITNMRIMRVVKITYCDFAFFYVVPGVSRRFGYLPGQWSCLCVLVFILTGPLRFVWARPAPPKPTQS
jgi:hypothetical protein